jgi:hypothetical protein
MPIFGGLNGRNKTERYVGKVPGKNTGIDSFNK